MTTAAPAANRRSLLHYAIGIDLVIIVAGIGLLLDAGALALVALHLAAVALAAWRGGWKVGMVTTIVCVLSLGVAFEGVARTTHLVLFAIGGVALSLLVRSLRPASAAVATTPAVDAARHKAVEDEQTAIAHAATASNRRIQRALPYLIYAGLPIVVLLIYTNISDVLIRNFSIPSVLQPMILLLAIPVLRYRNVFRPDAALTHPVTIGLIAYCLYIFASSSWARDVSAADTTLMDTVKDLVILVVVASLAVTWRALRGALIAVVAAAAFLSVLTLIQVAADNPDMQFGGLAALEVGHLFGDLDDLRPSGPVGDPNYFARILILALPLAAYLGFGRRSRKEQIAYAAAAAVITLAILFTYSRGAMVALAAVAVLLVAFGRVRITPVTAALAVVVLIALIPTTIGKRLLTMGAVFEESVDNSLDKRMLLLEAGWRMFGDHPIAGVGAGNFGSHYPVYANLVGWTGRDYTPVGVRQYPHNLYLEMAVETGVLGLLIFLTAMAAALLTLLQSRRVLLARGETANAALVTAIGIALAGYLASSLFLHSGYQRYLLLGLAFAVAAVRLTNDGPAPDEARG